MTPYIHMYLFVACQHLIYHFKITDEHFPQFFRNATEQSHVASCTVTLNILKFRKLLLRRQRVLKATRQRSLKWNVLSNVSWTGLTTTNPPVNPFPPKTSWCWSECPLLTSSLSLDRLHVYISSACPDLVGSWLPFTPAADCRSKSSGSICLATSAELFANWFSSWVLFSRFSTGSGRMAAPSGGADWMYSEGNGEEADWTAGPSPSFTTSCEEVGSVRMFLEITEATEECLDFETWNLQPQNKWPTRRHELTSRCQLAGRWRNEPPVGL